MLMPAYVIKPNLGCPALVNGTVSDLVFQAVFASDDPNLDLKSALSGNLFLQRLEDTQTVIQKEATAANYIHWASPNNPGVLAVAHWPKDIKSRLIPLEVVSFGQASNRPLAIRSMTGGYLPYQFVQYIRWQYSATLRIPPEYVSGTDFSHLFNLVQIPDLGSSSHCRINYHAIYIHKQDWHDFSFLHITDPHLAWRNDFIEEVIRGRLGSDSAKMDLKKRYHNWNQKFRDFIAYANSLHQAGLIDFIILTGDIVDYVSIGIQYQFYTKGDRVTPFDNVELFLQLVTGWPNCDRVPGEELEVPIFTCPGNHDYRPAEYPLYGNVKLSLPIIGLFYEWELTNISQWGDFGLTEQEASIYASITEGDPCPTYDQNQGIEFVLPADALFPSYLGLLNPEPDYTIRLGKHRILCMDTGYDAAVITSVSDYLSGSGKSRDNFIAGKPDSIGFTDKQIGFIKTHMGAREGLVILACHAPVVNYKEDDWYSPRDVPRDPVYGYQVATNNFDAFVTTLYQDHVKHIDLILSGHTHTHREFEFEPSTSEHCYHFKGDIFSDLLANAPDKSLWWSQQPAYLIQTPSIMDSEMLGVVVKNDVITELQQLKIGPIPNIVPWLSVLLLEEKPSIVPSLSILI